ncbi:hypothetical protein PS1M3_17410 [Pseudoalteromonas sp. PS1M3]|jgi:hypothetical protein|uniref:hypothetical protein n=1 Tax=unclassified Pseudoalteromonas TaxID=194690 RepID=UPI000517EAA6|nr:MULTISPECIES: hypothetical protein [unclassified Pseudoalteromonas]MBL1385192.1 hypothetical protein [Colwellia sp.]TMS79569.1 hypothetical protein CWB65_19520 [Pseudoalteromonas sp. S554]BBW91654.1 hypothetical protein PS1M3_17410 [Pseudoalteromonas sp. PS1M3]|tara:strand:+ start:1138 stop:1398 length:261 start_codon:yes stop_codon:yes gene_type:complete
MKNKIETFNKFNRGARRTDRQRHLELCGFTFKGLFLIDRPITPKSHGESLARSFNKIHKKECHIVYWVGQKNMDGQTSYQYWIKQL